MDSILLQSMSWHLHLNTIQVSHVSIQVPIHESDLHLGPYIKFYMPSRSCITFTAVQRLASQPHSGPTWLPSRSRYLHPTSIHVPIWAFPIWAFSQSMSWNLRLNTIQLMPHMHPCPEILHLHHIQVSRHAPHLHPGPVPPATRSQDSHLASLHVASHFYMDLTISVPRIDFPSSSHPTCI